jgi:acyl-coenzyme A synthetase/AMP-(fatty) acid ligase
VIELRESLPRQENGKIKKRLLRSEFERQLAQAADHP